MGIAHTQNHRVLCILDEQAAAISTCQNADNGLKNKTSTSQRGGEAIQRPSKTFSVDTAQLSSNGVTTWPSRGSAPSKVYTASLGTLAGKHCLTAHSGLTMPPIHTERHQARDTYLPRSSAPPHIQKRASGIAKDRGLRPDYGRIARGSHFINASSRRREH